MFSEKRGMVEKPGARASFLRGGRRGIPEMGKGNACSTYGTSGLGNTIFYQKLNFAEMERSGSKPQRGFVF
jgi:hypothetical protein